jgi:phosphohistidine phosphatase
MKTLTLFRHGKSGWDSPVSRDFDRPLNVRGERGSRLMGQHFQRQGWAFDHVMSSPAVRCTQTLDAFWDGYGHIMHPNWDRRIYLASGAILIDVIGELPDDADSVLLCGHNPGMEDVVLLLVPDTQGDLLRDSVEEKFPTAATAELRLDIMSWADVKKGCATFVHHIRPRDLDPSLGPGLD